MAVDPFGASVLIVGFPEATVQLLDLLGRVLLHEGTHTEAAASSGAVGLEYVAASVAFVGVVGGLLYWYFGTREWTR